mgnify:CR=1 FL=1
MTVSLNPADYPVETRPVSRRPAHDADWFETSDEPKAILYRVNRALQIAGISSSDYHWESEHLYWYFMNVPKEKRFSEELKPAPKA